MISKKKRTLDRDGTSTGYVDVFTKSVQLYCFRFVFVLSRTDMGTIDWSKVDINPSSRFCSSLVLVLSSPYLFFVFVIIIIFIRLFLFLFFFCVVDQIASARLKIMRGISESTDITEATWKGLSGTIWRTRSAD